MIKGISNRIMQLVNNIESDTGKIEKETVMGWIEDTTDRLDKISLQHIVTFLAMNGNSKDNLLKVYSFIDERINN